MAPKSLSIPLSQAPRVSGVVFFVCSVATLFRDYSEMAEAKWDRTSTATRFRWGRTGTLLQSHRANVAGLKPCLLPAIRTDRLELADK